MKAKVSFEINVDVIPAGDDGVAIEDAEQASGIDYFDDVKVEWIE